MIRLVSLDKLWGDSLVRTGRYSDSQKEILDEGNYFLRTATGLRNPKYRRPLGTTTVWEMEYSCKFVVCIRIRGRFKDTQLVSYPHQHVVVLREYSSPDHVFSICHDSKPRTTMVHVPRHPGTRVRNSRATTHDSPRPPLDTGLESHNSELPTQQLIKQSPQASLSRSLLFSLRRRLEVHETCRSK